jgi:hypothetical protein
MVVNKEMGRTLFPTVSLDEQKKATRNLGLNLMFVDPCITVKFIKKNPTRCHSVSTFYYSLF